MNEIGSSISGGAAAAWASVILWGPKLVMFIAILVIGYFVAKLICKVLNRVLERVGFDRLVERGGIKRALERSSWDASDILSKLAFYFVMLFTLQLAFGVFGPNPVSAMLTSIIAYLPNVFVAMLIVIIAGAIAAGVKTMAQAAFGGLRYGRMLGTVASVAVMVIGVFAALDQLNIAPAIVNGLYYATLAVIAGSAIIAIGGGGVVPMRRVWDRALNRLEQEAPKFKQEAEGAEQRIKARTEEVKVQAKHEYAHAKGDHPQEEHRETPRFQT
jgi:hypothetical protein